MDRSMSVHDGYTDMNDSSSSSSSSSSSNHHESTPLRSRILQAVRDAPHRQIRPARLSTQLGLSIADASAELCGLLQAVGPTATFRFENSMQNGSDSDVMTMVFDFPPDFEKRAMTTQTKDDWKEQCQEVLEVVVKFLKVLTAFGLIISTLIVSMAAVMALIGALVALSRGGGSSREQQRTMRLLNDVLRTVRELLWCYAIFGYDDHGNQDPFFRESAYEVWLMMSVCCGNPRSLFFWMRAGQLRRRRHRIARGWGRIFPNNSDNNNSSIQAIGQDPLEGVSLIRRGRGGEEDENVPVPPPSQPEHRGLLSVVVEVLFGSTTPSGPSETDKWRLRSAVIVETCTQQQNKGSAILLQQLGPFVDNPPSSLDDPKVATEGLFLVAYFNGTPRKQVQTSKIDQRGADRTSKRWFVFPELMAENSTAIRYEDFAGADADAGLFYLRSEDTISPTTATLPSSLQEEPKVLTRLTRSQFYHCLAIATANLLGVYSIVEALEYDSILCQTLGKQGVSFLKRSQLIPILWFYARLFFAIPTVRLLWIVSWNVFCTRRNAKRAKLAAELFLLQQEDGENDLQLQDESQSSSL